MKIIKQLIQNMTEQICDAEKYIKLAIKYQDEDERIANMYYNLSKEEIGHATMEHEQASRVIHESKTQAPSSMKAIWQWEHDKMIDHKSRVLALIEQFK